MPSVIVTDNQMSAASLYPGERIVSSITDVLGLADGTAVKVHQVKTGTVSDGPCHVAWRLIERGDLIEVDE